MIIENSGWNEKRGWFIDKYFVDEFEINYKIHWKNGGMCKQITPFEDVTRDWNYDGDVYTEFVAGFEGKYGGIDYWTPHHLISEILEGNITVDGIKKNKLINY